MHDHHTEQGESALLCSHSGLFLPGRYAFPPSPTKRRRQTNRCECTLVHTGTDTHSTRKIAPHDTMDRSVCRIALAICMVMAVAPIAEAEQTVKATHQRRHAQARATSTLHTHMHAHQLNQTPIHSYRVSPSVSL